MAGQSHFVIVGSSDELFLLLGAHILCVCVHSGTFPNHI